MEIAVERSHNVYTVTVGDQPIVALWPHSDQEIKEFIRTVRRVHGKRNFEDIIVGLLADHSSNYSNACNFQPSKGKSREKPFDLLVLYAEQHCLLILLEDNRVSKVIEDFLYHHHTVVVGVGIEKVVKKLEKDLGLLIPRRLELRDLVEADISLKSSIPSIRELSVSELARAVLGGGVFYVKPTKIKWWEISWTPYSRYFSNDLVKHSTVEAFLAAETAIHLLKK